MAKIVQAIPSPHSSRPIEREIATLSELLSLSYIAPFLRQEDFISLFIIKEKERCLLFVNLEEVDYLIAYIYGSIEELPIEEYMPESRSF